MKTVAEILIFTLPFLRQRFCDGGMWLWKMHKPSCSTYNFSLFLSVFSFSYLSLVCCLVYPHFPSTRLCINVHAHPVVCGSVYPPIHPIFFINVITRPPISSHLSLSLRLSPNLPKFIYCLRNNYHFKKNTQCEIAKTVHVWFVWCRPSNFHFTRCTH